MADRKNNLIRALDLRAKTVTTVAGTGEQGEDRDDEGPALKTALNSPWDLLLHDGKLYIAMAGLSSDLGAGPGQGRGRPLRRRRRGAAGDGPLAPRLLRPAERPDHRRQDALRGRQRGELRAAVPLDGKGDVKTIVGDDLFVFGDVDGVGDEVRLQHALGVA